MAFNNDVAKILSIQLEFDFRCV